MELTVQIVYSEVIKVNHAAASIIGGRVADFDLCFHLADIM